MLRGDILIKKISLVGVDPASIPSDQFDHRAPAQSVSVADCYFIVNVLDLPFASPIVVNRQLCI